MAVSVVDTVRINSTDLKNNEILVVEFCGFRCFLYAGKGRRLPCMCGLERLGTCKCLATGLNAFLSSLSTSPRCSRNRSPIGLPVSPIRRVGTPQGESACLPPTCSRFDSRTRGLSLLVLYSAPRGFSPGTSVFPSPQKPTFDLI